MTDDDKRDAKGRFLPGVSGNATGRPKGPTLKDLVEKDLPLPIISKLVARAAARGESWALRALMDRQWPLTQRFEVEATAELRHQEVVIETPADWLAKVERLLNAEREAKRLGLPPGELPPDLH